MEMEVKIAISNRHVHLTEEVYNKLFSEDLSVKNYLSQKGEFASNQVVSIKGPKGVIEKVRIVGPFRSYNQVEVASSDAYILGVNPPVRASGDLDMSSPITVIGPRGEVALDKGCIISERHLHLSVEEACELGLNNRDIVKFRVDNLKGGLLDARVKISSNGYKEIHIDRDDANSLLLNNGDIVEVIR